MPATLSELTILPLRAAILRSLHHLLIQEWPVQGFAEKAHQILHFLR
jgi:hypothetical protein